MHMIQVEIRYAIQIVMIHNYEEISSMSNVVNIKPSKKATETN